MGVLQKDLVTAIESGNNCKIEVFKALEKDLLKDDLSDRSKEGQPGNAPKKDVPPPTASSTEPSADLALEPKAINFAHAFLQAGSAPGNQAMQFFSEHYGTKVNYFQHKAWPVQEVLNDKKRVVFSTERTYHLLPGLSAVCNNLDRKCVVNGLTDYKVAGATGIKCGQATLILEVTFSGSVPLILTERGQAHPSACL